MIKQLSHSQCRRFFFSPTSFIVCFTQEAENCSYEINQCCRGSCCAGAPAVWSENRNGRWRRWSCAGLQLECSAARWVEAEKQTLRGAKRLHASVAVFHRAETASLTVRPSQWRLTIGAIHTEINMVHFVSFFLFIIVFFPLACEDNGGGKKQKNKNVAGFIVVLEHGKLNCHEIFVVKQTKSNQQHLVVAVTPLTQTSLNDSQKLVITRVHDITCFNKKTNSSLQGWTLLLAVIISIVRGGENQSSAAGALAAVFCSLTQKAAHQQFFFFLFLPLI